MKNKIKTLSEIALFFGADYICKDINGVFKICFREPLKKVYGWGNIDPDCITFYGHETNVDFSEINHLEWDKSVIKVTNDE